MKDFGTLEKSPEATFYREFFYPCRTLLVYSTCGEKRRFVEQSESTDFSNDIHSSIDEVEISVHNATRRLLSENNNRFFFPANSDKCHKIIIDGEDYWLKYEDISANWPNHFWLRTKGNIVGFKTVSHNNTSILSKQELDTQQKLSYEPGQTYSKKEEAMLDKPGIGFYFSPQIEKALCYKASNPDAKVLLVTASGLTYIKNSWDDLAASTLTVVKELSQVEIQLFQPNIEQTRYTWNGHSWHQCFVD